MSTYLEDVCAQAEDLKTALGWYEKTGVLESIQKIGKYAFHRLVFSGMGSSHYCAIGAGIYLKQHGVDNQVISTGELLYYEKEFLTSDTLLVLISQSGESAETARLLEKLPDALPVIAVTNDENSTLAKRGRIVLPLCVREEEAVTTRTYLASICLTMLLAAQLAGEGTTAMLEKLHQAAGALERTLAEKERIEAALEPFASCAGAPAVLGRGYSLCSVQAGALFLREIVRIPAMAFDEAEFKHGPLEMVEPGFRAVVFAPSGPGAGMNIAMAESIVQKGGIAVLVTDRNCMVQNRDRLIVIRLECLEEYLVPLFQIVPVQLLADSLAKKRGITAGKFRWGSKVMASET